jgi:hypothetical protein
VHVGEEAGMGFRRVEDAPFFFTHLGLVA